MSTAGGRAYETIRRAVLDGGFAPGTRLKEEELTALCGVSRTPVREALRRLAVEGLVVVTPHQGAQVVFLEPAELEDSYDLRTLIESRAAARAASRIKPETLERLSRLQDVLESAVAAGPLNLADRFIPLNAQFHQIILEAAASARLAAMAHLVAEAPSRIRTLSRYSAEDLDRSMRHHRELIAALTAQDADWAASAMMSHVRAALQVLLRDESERSAVGRLGVVAGRRKDAGAR